MRQLIATAVTMVTLCAATVAAAAVETPTALPEKLTATFDQASGTVSLRSGEVGVIVDGLSVDIGQKSGGRPWPAAFG